MLRVGAACQGFVGSPSILDALARGTLVWSRSEEVGLLEELDRGTAGCMPVRLSAARLASGRTADWDGCTVLSGAFTECAPGSSCGPVIFHASPNACIPGGVGGVGVAYSATCGRGLRCAPRCDRAFGEGICAPLRAPGESCSHPLDCDGIAVCEQEAGPTSRGTCVLQRSLASGERCTTTVSCAGWCDIGWTAVSPYPEGVCRDLRADGEECSAWMECASGSCPGAATLTDPWCMERDERCTVSTDDCTCGLRVAPGACGPPGPEGTRCVDSQSCASRWCERGLCSRPAGLGDPCDERNPCMTGACSGGTCIEPPRWPAPALGEPCTDGAFGTGCAVGICAAGVCTPAECTATLGWGHGSFAESPLVLTPR